MGVGSSAAVAFEGMPEPEAVCLWRRDGEVLIGCGHRLLHRFDDDDIGMRNLALVSLTSSGLVSNLQAGVLFGLNADYIAKLRTRARRRGSWGLVPPLGRPSKLDARDRAKVLRLAAAGVTGQDIARRFGVSGATISRIVAGASTPLALPVEPDGDSAPGADSDVAGTGEEPAPGSTLSPVALVPVAVGGPARRCRYAGAMLLWPFLGVVGFEDVFAGVVGGPARRFDDLSVLAATVFGFALGASSLEGIKHLGRADLGGLVAREHAPELRTLRPRLGAIADACDPVEIQTALSRGLRASDEAPAQVFFVDDHFVPYSGAAPLAKGWDAKRRHATKGRTDTYIVDLDRRALCFSSTEPTGLSRTIGGAVAQLRAICGPGTAITLGFDRGGSYPAVFSALRDEGVTWITWRRGDITAPAVKARWSWFALDGARHTYLLADETVDLAGYGPARQISIFENGEVVAQVLTCDTTATAARMVHLLRCRWRIENAFKYLGDHHGIGWLCEYRMDLIANNHEIANPARTTARAQLRTAQGALVTAQAALGRALTEPGPVATFKARINALRNDTVIAADNIIEAKAALKPIPAKIAATDLNPNATRAVPRLQRRSLQMVLRLLAYNAELWLSDRLDAYLGDPDEIRAITRHLLHQPGTITHNATTINVTITRPDQPRIARALTHLIDELNATPPHLPGDNRPTTYTISP